VIAKDNAEKKEPEIKQQQEVAEGKEEEA